MGILSKLSEKCTKCPYVDNCKDKRMEGCAYMDNLEKELNKATSELISQNPMMDAAMPISRERVLSNLSPFVYKDELERALYGQLYSQLYDCLRSAT